MTKTLPPEFKRDVVRVARRGDLSQAEGRCRFDISVESMRRWVRQADVDDSVVDGQTDGEHGSPAPTEKQKECPRARRRTPPAAGMVPTCTVFMRSLHDLRSNAWQTKQDEP